MAAAKRGFTLAEIIIGIAITSLVGLAVAGLSAALSNAYDVNEEYYQALQTGRSAMLKMQSALRRTRLVVGKTESGLLLWASDENNSGTINASELLLFRWDQASGEIREHRIDLDSLSPELRAAFDEAVTLNTSVTGPGSVSAWIRGHWYHQSRVLAEGVENFQATDQPALPMSKLLKIGLTAGSPGNEVTLRGVVKIRADMTDQVQVVADQYVLEAE